MPKTYTVQDDSGRKITFEWNGDAPPTEEDLQEVFASAQPAAGPQASPPDQPQAPLPPYDPLQAQAAHLGRIGQGFVGAAKGVARTAVGLGELVDRGTGALNAVVGNPQGRPVGEDFYRQVRSRLAPTNDAQRMGQGAEQTLEFMAPGGLAVKTVRLPAAILRGALEAGTVAAAQEGDVNANTLRSAAFGAAGPIASRLVAGTGRYFRGSAEKLLQQVLKPVGKAAKDKAEAASRLMLDEGVGVGNRRTLATRMQKVAEGADAARVSAEAGAASELVDSRPILAELEAARDRFVVKGTGVISNEAKYQSLQAQIDKLQEITDQLGSHLVPRETLLSLKQGLDASIYERGNPEGKAMKELADRTRGAMAGAREDIAALNQRFSTAKNAATMLARGAREEIGKTPSRIGTLFTAKGALSALAGGGAGAALGGGVPGAIVGAMAPLEVLRVLDSPVWKSFSAMAKNQVSQLLQAGAVQDAANVVARVLASRQGSPRTVGEEADADPRRDVVTPADLEFERRIQATRAGMAVPR